MYLAATEQDIFDRCETVFRGMELIHLEVKPGSPKFFTKAGLNRVAVVVPLIMMAIGEGWRYALIFEPHMLWSNRLHMKYICFRISIMYEHLCFDRKVRTANHHACCELITLL